MKQTKILMSFVLAFTILVMQVGAVFAAPDLQGSVVFTGMVQSITLGTDTVTGVTTIAVTLSDGGALQTVRLNLEKAITLGLVLRNGDGSPVINESALGQTIEVDSAAVIPDEQEAQHPVGAALAAFFSDVLNLDYDTIMAAHKEGTGFGIIAQALWLTRKLDGDVEVFLAILEAKKTGDFSAFLLEDGTTPRNWGELRKAILDGSRKGGLGIIMSGKDNTSNANGNGSGNGNGNSNGNANGNRGNSNNKDKDRDKGKGRNK